MNIKNFCDSCQHSEKRAKEMPCSICLQVGLRWKEPVFYCQEGKEEEKDMMSTEGKVFCVYQTPCGYCSKFDKECDKRECKNKNTEASVRGPEPILNAAGEYAAKFARNHGISIEEAMNAPMVKARFDFFNKTGL